MLINHSEMCPHFIGEETKATHLAGLVYGFRKLTCIMTQLSGAPRMWELGAGALHWWQPLMLLCHSVVPSLVMVYWFPYMLAFCGLLVCP